MKKERIIVIDFGGQYNQLIARRVRECNVYCEIYSYKKDLEEIKAMNPKGIILTGGPNSCYEPGAPTCDKRLFQLGIPILGICYGAQLMMHVLGGRVEKAPVREYGKTEVIVDKSDSSIFEGVSAKTTCWMSHFDYVSRISVHAIADGKVEAMEFLADEHTRNCGKPLKELKLKPNVLVVSISHGANTEIANGNSVFQKGDIVVVVDSNSREVIRQLNDIFA